MAFTETKKRIADYTKHKSWLWYLPIWLLGIYAFVAILDFDPNKPAKLIILLPRTFDFTLHEFAHILTAFLPSLFTAAAGSASELALGILLVYGAFRTRCYFASMICFLWLMLACQSAGIYMADARVQRMELVSLGGALAGSDQATHDWHYIFGQLNILELDAVIGNVVRGVGAVAGLVGLAFAAWLMYRMAAASDHALSTKEAALLHATTEEHSEALQVKKSTNLYPTPTKGALAERPKPPEPKHNKPA